MKKTLAILCGLMLLFSLVACGGPAASGSTSGASSVSASIPSVVIESVDDLEGKVIGVQQGTTGDIYAADIEGATVERFNNGADAVMALRQGKIDCVIIDDQPAGVYVSMYDDLKILDEPFEVEEYAICVAKDNTELVEAMNGAIAKLKADGTVDSILDYYINGVEGAQPYTTPEGTEYPNGKLVMATNAAFPPYEYWEGGEVKGVDADLARAICDKLGYELQIDDMEFASIIVAVQSGKADFGAAGMTVTEDRLQNVNFTDTYCTATQVIIVRK